MMWVVYVYVNKMKIEETALKIRTSKDMEREKEQIWQRKWEKEMTCYVNYNILNI